MLDLNELEQLILFARAGTLADVAESCHISAPSVTRAMKHLEEEFGVTLFKRGKNRIELNESGYFAVEAAEKIIREHDRQLEAVREFDRRRKSVSVLSCAPAPLWDLLPGLAVSSPDRMVTSQIVSPEQVEAAFESQECTYAILPYPYRDFKPLLTEKLYISVKKGHELASRKSISFHDINGFNFLIRSEIGFWDRLCRDKMPASRFLVQTDEFEFKELIESSSLPCFATDVGIAHGFSFEDRVVIPITDREAAVTFYINRKPQEV